MTTVDVSIGEHELDERLVDAITQVGTWLGDHLQLARS
jgi:hypothetical protein